MHRTWSTLVADTEAALWAGIAAARLGGRVGDISAAVERRLREDEGRYGILEDYTGHGIGTAMHQPPDVPNVGRRDAVPAWSRAWRSRSSRWSPSAATRPTLLDDDWTVVTADGSWAAHAEHTFALPTAARGC